MVQPPTTTQQPAGAGGGEGATERSLEKGVVVTATELEGPAPAADWSRWIDRGRAPDATDLPNFDSSWREDWEQLALLGASAIQMTLEWARLEPVQGRHDIEEIEFRRDLLEAARGHGLRTWACLVDGTLPGWFSDDEGGFGDDRSRTLLWPRHIDWIGEHFGDLVDGWVPQREPLTWAVRRYLRAEAPPGRRDPRQAAEAAQAAILADGEAWRLLRGTAPVATYQTLRPVRAEAAPGGGDDLKARPLAQHLERLLWHPWLSAITEGRLIAGDLAPIEVDHLRGAFDRVIVELRPTVEVQGNGRWRREPPQVGPMIEILRRAADELEEHEVVAAGSLAGLADDGRARPDHMQAMLAATDEAAAETSVVGWWQSSPIDGYHWEAGTTGNPGLIGRDRRESASAQSYREHPA